MLQNFPLWFGLVPGGRHNGGNLCFYCFRKVMIIFSATLCNAKPHVTNCLWRTGENKLVNLRWIKNYSFYALYYSFAWFVFFIYGLALSGLSLWQRGADHVTFVTMAMCHKTKHDCDEFLKMSSSTSTQIHCIVRNFIWNWQTLLLDIDIKL